MIKDICTPYNYLKLGIKDVKESKSLQVILSLALRIGNTMNDSEIECFAIDTLLKLSSLKDNSAKKTLLYFILKSAIDNKMNIDDLSEKFQNLGNVSKTDFDEVGKNLKQMEEQCKSALGYLKLAATFDKATRNLVETFLVDSVKEILSSKIAIKMVSNLFSDFLLWLGKFWKAIMKIKNKLFK